MTERNQSTVAALAFLVTAIRPDWSKPGVVGVLNRVDPAVDLAALSHAAITAAATRRDQTTPAIIAMTGPHWGNCTGEKPAVGLPPWRDPFADTTPADPETIRAIRARKESA